jgi:signal transduction histidine kinase
MVSASLGVTSGWLGGVIPAHDVADAWWTWWLGDMAGDLVFAPLLFVWLAQPVVPLPARRIIEAAVLIAFLAAASLFVFGGTAAWRTSFEAFLLFPLLLVAALRFGQHGAVTATALLAMIAIWRTAEGLGPFAHETLHEALRVTQAFMIVGVSMTLCLAADVSERKQAERELRDARAELETKVQHGTIELEQAQKRLLQAERLAAIGEMAAGLAHESRNALQQIQSSLEMLARRLRGLPEAQYVVDIQKAEDRLLRLFEDIRGYAAPVNLDRQAHNLADIWREAWHQLNSHYTGREARLEEQIDGLNLICAVDQFSLERVFHNILLNSLAACSSPASIKIRCAETELNGQPALSVAVQDNGPGLSAEQRQRIFEPFYTTKTKGTGLGMAITKRVVEAHGGQIILGTDPRPGAEIVIILPREAK